MQLPENVATRAELSRTWNGVEVNRHESICTGRVSFKLVRNESLTRLGALLEEVGRDHLEARAAQATPNPHGYRPRGLYFAPARMELWGHSEDCRFLNCAVVSFDAQALCERLHLPNAQELIEVPRLRFFDERLWTLVKLLTDAIHDPDPTAQLYGDSLTAAIGAKLFDPPKEVKGSERGLSASQLKDAISYLEARMPSRVELDTLADLAGLSQSHYSRAFKASTGLAPYQWQLKARIEHAKDLLLNTNDSLSDIANSTGFADAVHFGRTFRKIIGASPAAWRLDRLT